MDELERANFWVVLAPANLTVVPDINLDSDGLVFTRIETFEGGELLHDDWGRYQERALWAKDDQ